MSESNARSSQAYPLSSLFLVLTVFAAIAALISPIMDGSSGPRSNTVLYTGLMGVAGGIFGMIIGLCHYRRLFGGMIGILCGIVFGAMSGPAMVVSNEHPQKVILLSAFGAVFILGMVACFRKINNRDPVSRTDVYIEKLKAWQSESIVPTATLVEPDNKKA